MSPRGTGNWIIRKSDERILPYYVIRPDGSLCCLRQTWWGARRELARQCRKHTLGGWWDAPIVHEETDNGRP